jgi:hypothetical protein
MRSKRVLEGGAAEVFAEPPARGAPPAPPPAPGEAAPGWPCSALSALWPPRPGPERPVVKAPSVRASLGAPRRHRNVGREDRRSAERLIPTARLNHWRPSGSASALHEASSSCLVRFAISLPTRSRGSPAGASSSPQTRRSRGTGPAARQRYALLGHPRGGRASSLELESVGDGLDQVVPSCRSEFLVLRWRRLSRLRTSERLRACRSSASATALSFLARA